MEDTPLIPLEHYLTLASILFVIGLLGAIVRKNVFFILISIQIMLNASILTFVVSSKYIGGIDGQIAAAFIMIFSVCQATLGLSIISHLYRKYKTSSTNFFKVLQG